MLTHAMVSSQTQRNWWLDGLLATSGLLAALSGIYFLYFPVGGYMGGRNPYYNLVILFSRSTWEDLHTWGGLAMIVIAVVHIILHWSWITSMTRRVFKELTGQCGCMNSRGRFNLAINTLVGLSFLVTALSGVYLFFVPHGRDAIDPYILFSRTTWDLIHTWAGILMISTGLLHFIIHWKWVVKVTKGMLRVLAATFTNRSSANQWNAKRTSTLESE